jgi:DNA-binding transcriptional LysR family regulator
MRDMACACCDLCLHGLLQLPDHTHIDLAHSLARDAVLPRQILKRRRIVLEGTETDLPIETFAALPYITITSGGDDTHFIDDALAERGLARLVSAKVPLHSLILMLIGSKALAVVPRWVAVDLVGVCPLAMRPLPFPPPRVAPSMIWHRRLDNDAAHRWLRGTVRPAVTGN